MPAGPVVAQHRVRGRDQLVGFDRLGQVRVGAAGQAALNVGGTGILVSGNLHITFVNDYKPAAGSTIQIMQCSTVCAGTFSTVTVDGVDATPVYTTNGVSLMIN